MRRPAYSDATVRAGDDQGVRVDLKPGSLIRELVLAEVDEILLRRGNLLREIFRESRIVAVSRPEFFLARRTNKAPAAFPLALELKRKKISE